MMMIRIDDDVIASKCKQDLETKQHLERALNVDTSSLFLVEVVIKTKRRK